MANDNQREKVFALAGDVTRQMITLSTGAVALTITFAKEVSDAYGKKHHGVLAAAWTVHVISIVFGVLTLMRLAGTLEKTEQGQPSIYSGGSVILASTQVVTFIAGMVALVVYAWLSVR